MKCAHIRSGGAACRAKNSLTIRGNSAIIRLARKARSYGLTGLARYDRFVVRYNI